MIYLRTRKLTSALLIGILVLVSQSLKSQSNEGAYWYFGAYAGLTWCTLTTSGDPTPLMDGQVTTYEGVATIGDPNCNLLFYSDGITVWDATHTPMTNSLPTSPGGELLGDPSSTQSGVIVPKPIDPNTYYLFAVDNNIGSDGLTYSRIDMTANFGLGDVDLAEKNISLYTPSTEKISAVNHSNGTDIWVVTHQWQSNGYVCYLVTSAGVNTVSPVISMVGSVMTGASAQTRGYLKASPGGGFMVAACEGGDYYELYDFDNATGVLSNPRTLTGPQYDDCYGVEFSQDEHYLYGSERWGTDLRQFDITLTSAAAIQASEFMIATLPTASGGALQLAIDGKIYLARNNQKYLGRINDPLAAGLATNYVDAAILLGPDEPTAKTSHEGLPTFITSFFNQAEFTFVTSCFSDTVLFTIPNPTGLDSAFWNFNYPTTNPAYLYASSEDSITFVYPQGGIYQVQLITERNNTYDTLIQEVYISHIPDAYLGPNQTLCTNDTLYFDFSFNDPYALDGSCEYFWEAQIGTYTFYDSVPTYAITKPGTYTLTIYSDSICGSATDQLEVIFNNVEADLGLDVTSGLCLGDSYTLDATYNDPQFGTTTYHWSTGQFTPTLNVTMTGQYWVTVSLGYCSDTASVYVQFDQPLINPLGNDQYLCNGSSVTFSALNPGASYIWSTGGQAQEETFTDPGTYGVTVTNACGTVSDAITLMPLDVPDVNLGPDITICEGFSEILDAATGGPNETYLWSNGWVTPQIAITTQGLYNVTVTNQCGSSFDAIYVNGDQELTNIFGNDTSVCDGFILDCNVPNAEYYWSNGATTQSIVVDQTGDFGVDVTNACGTYSDLINVEIMTIDDPLPNDTVLCPGETIILDAGNPGYIYTWSTGAITQTTQINTGGEYWVLITNICESTADTVIVSEYDGNLDLGMDTAICSGDEFILDAGHPGATYLWSNGETTQSIVASTTDLYSVTVSHYCGDLSDDLNLTVNPSPMAEFPSDSIITSDPEVTLIPEYTGAVAYLWSNGETTESITVTSTGWYTVTVTSTEGCESESSVYVGVNVGIFELPESSLITVYPNPATTWVELDLGTIQAEYLELYNTLGELILNQKLNSKISRINMESLPNGVYFIRINRNNEQPLVKSFTKNN